MKRIITLVFIATFIVGLLALLPISKQQNLNAVARVQAQQASQNAFGKQRVRECSLGTLNGAYGVLAQGTNIHSPVIPPGPFAGLMIITFDGQGNYTAQLTANLSGVQTPPFDGALTYEVNGDCTGVFHGPEGYDYKMVITDSGEEFHMMFDVTPNPNVPSGGLVAGGVGKRIAPLVQGNNPFDRARSFQCTPGTMEGNYALSTQGAMLNMPGVPTGPFHGMGIANSDGIGTFTFSGLNSYNGKMVTLQEEYSFNVNSDCTGAISGATNYKFIAVHGGNELLLLETYPDGVNFPPGQGAVCYGQARKM